MKRAVFLISMGGPSSLKEVRPFLFNLFKDPAILHLPAFLRLPLAAFIAFSRNKEASENYNKIGGRSPLLTNTKKQAEALEKKLKETGDFRCFVGMRYAAPLIEDVVKEIAAFAPEKVILLPLYPQYSTTTTGTALNKAKKALKKAGIDEEKITAIESFFEAEGFLSAMQTGVTEAYEKAKEKGRPIVLFSAHGLPLSIVEGGDPYQEQCQKTAEALGARLPKEIETRLCYQSRVGRGAWLRPYTIDETEKAARAGRPIIFVPLSFVCEHVETLVELGIEYRNKALFWGSPMVEIVPTVGTKEIFIESLAAIVREKDTKNGG